MLEDIKAISPIVWIIFFGVVVPFILVNSMKDK